MFVVLVIAGADQVMIPSTSVALEVQFAAYLAVLLGTFVPVAFLIILYIQSESRKAGEAAGGK
jgi:photosystem II PsbM protein